MIGRLRRYVARQQFDPGLLAIWTNPFFFARRHLRRAIRQLAPRLGGTLLDVGCGTTPYRSLFAVRHYIGLEIDTPEARARQGADAYYDGTTFPFPAASMDAVFCSQVLEHVFVPERFVVEIARVLRPGGQLLLTVPFVWDEHEQPRDYARYTTFGLKALLENHGLRLIEQQRLCSGAGVLAQLTNAYLYKVTRSRSNALNWLAQLLLIAPTTLLGLLFAALLPDNPDLYLDQIVLAEKIE
ncbi:class I SAM-dependent methyltransferase [Ramlibacter sp.]|uniref:class I SAM-dependent methyltransferase n=1 Tax=Ramlibacter sp. TaxID=1917967 RepID=UPI0017994FFF|nr:class I SAM-dependent methyltransferase [Ramlibacter sp.]MBA2673306.1 methyltransferase domain-containing protein [Ramlibacter sp.]